MDSEAQGTARGKVGGKVRGTVQGTARDTARDTARLSTSPSCPGAGRRSPLPGSQRCILHWPFLSVAVHKHAPSGTVALVSAQV